MINLLSRAFDNLFGRGEAAVTVPPLDGAFRPNRALDEAGRRNRLAGVDCLTLHDGELIASAGETIHVADAGGHWVLRKTFDQTVACIASAGGYGLAVALVSGDIIFVGGSLDGRRYRANAAIACLTSIVASGGSLYVTNGSATGKPSDWQRELLDRGSTGSIWRIDLESGESTRVADGLSWPAGLAMSEDGLVVSEAFRHRLIRLETQGRISQVLLADLPGYPGRLSPSAGGWWLAVFAPRSQLVEFVLREPGYRRRMVAEVPEAFWIAPKLKSGRSYYEPLQGGGVKHLGILKPWAPTMSFGMCVWLDAGFQPRLSFQSRADGDTHGVTSVIEWDGSVFAAARGDDAVVGLPMPGAMGEPG